MNKEAALLRDIDHRVALHHDWMHVLCHVRIRSNRDVLDAASAAERGENVVVHARASQNLRLDIYLYIFAIKN